MEVGVDSEKLCLVFSGTFAVKWCNTSVGVFSEVSVRKKAVGSEKSGGQVCFSDTTVTGVGDTGGELPRRELDPGKYTSNGNVHWVTSC